MCELEIKVENIDEIKKLIEKAKDQVNQLEETLTEIQKIKIQVS